MPLAFLSLPFPRLDLACKSPSGLALWLSLRMPDEPSVYGDKPKKVISCAGFLSGLYVFNQPLRGGLAMPKITPELLLLLPAQT